MSDLTERKRLEREYHQAQKLETVGRLTGGIAHDFNNVLMAIMSSIDVLLSKLDDDSELRAFAEGVKREAVRGTTLTRQLLSFSRKRETQVEVLDLDAVVASLQPMLQPMLGNKITLQVTLGGGGRILADRAHIEQILVNLVSNARDAIADTGMVEIHVARVQLDTEHARIHGLLPGPYVEFGVRDSGCGMDDETRSKSMEPFFTTKADGEGTGLGLSTVYGMVEQARGRLSIDSTVGEGTAVRILLPEFDESRPESTTRHDATVLVVEDEEQIRAGIARSLERAGYTVHTTETAEAALALVEEGLDVDLLLTDIVLPGMSGSELAKRLGGRGVPVVFMSAYPTTKLRREGRIPERAHSLHKPFKPSELLRAIEAALGTPSDEEPRPLPAARVLILEDNDTTRAAYREILTGLGLETLEAETGAEARALASNHRFDLLLVDLGLPDEPGTRVVAALRELFPEVAVLFITGRPENDPTLVAPLSTPRTQVMTKPVDLDDLIRAISGLLRS